MLRGWLERRRQLLSAPGNFDDPFSGIVGQANREVFDRILPLFHRHGLFGELGARFVVTHRRARDHQRPLSWRAKASQQYMLALWNPRPAEVQVRIRFNRGWHIGTDPPHLPGLDELADVPALELRPSV